MQKTVYIKAIDAAAADTNSGYIPTHTFGKVKILVDWTSDGTGDGTLTFYGAVTNSATGRYLLGVAPELTGSIDADGAVTMGTTSSCIGYEVEGIHPYIYLDWNNAADVQAITVYIIGSERIG
jgi:hypothetical protein